MRDLDCLYRELTDTVELCFKRTGLYPTVLKVTNEEFNILKNYSIKYTGKLPSVSTFMGVPLEIVDSLYWDKEKN